MGMSQWQSHQQRILRLPHTFCPEIDRTLDRAAPGLSLESHQGHSIYIAVLFTAREVIASRRYARDEVCVIMTIGLGKIE